MISHTQLGVYLGLYEERHMNTPEFHHFLMDFPVRMTHTTYWNILVASRSRKVSRLSNPAHQYIHALLTRGVGGKLDCTGVMSCSDFIMMYSIIEHYPIHLGHPFANMLTHQVCLHALELFFTVLPSHVPFEPLG